MQKATATTDAQKAEAGLDSLAGGRGATQALVAQEPQCGHQEERRPEQVRQRLAQETSHASGGEGAIGTEDVWLFDKAKVDVNDCCIFYGHNKEEQVPELTARC